MELPIAVAARCEIRAVIRFLNAKRILPTEIHRQLMEVYGKKCISVQHVRKWCREFSEGCIEIHDEDRSGRPSVSDEIVQKVQSILLEVRRITINELALHIPDISNTTVHKILTEKS